MTVEIIPRSSPRKYGTGPGSNLRSKIWDWAGFAILDLVVIATATGHGAITFRHCTDFNLTSH